MSAIKSVMRQLWSIFLKTIIVHILVQRIKVKEDHVYRYYRSSLLMRFKGKLEMMQ